MPPAPENAPMATPRVSVVMPVYNKAPFLKEAIDSILAQTFTDFEIVAVDDKSTDNSLEILRSIQDPRMRVVALERNLGPAGAAQRAMDVARGEYIVRQDADDLMYPDRIERQVAFMDANTDLGASGGQVTLFGAEDVEWRYPLTRDECRAQLLFGVPVPQPGSILRTRLLREHGVRYQDHWPRIGEDWLFWTALGKHCAFANIDPPVIRYRRGPQNISHGKDLAALRKGRVEIVLREFGLEPTEREVEMHLLAKRSFLRPPDRRTIQDYRTWLDKLKAHNNSAGLFPRKQLVERIEQAWDELYHQLPPFGSAPALEHMRISGSYPLGRMMYLLKCRLNALRQGGQRNMAA